MRLPLKKISLALRAFKDFTRDGDVQIQTIQTFLLIIEAENALVNYSDIARVTGVSQAAVSRNIKKLAGGSRETRGYELITVELDPYDSRRRIIKLSKRGKDLASAMEAAYLLSPNTTNTIPSEIGEHKAADVDVLVRELDLLLNGENGEARPASLNELVAQVAAIKRTPPIAWYRASPEESDWYWDSEIKAGCCPRSDIPHLVALYSHLPPGKSEQAENATPGTMQEAADDLFNYLDSYRDAQLDIKVANLRKFLDNPAPTGLAPHTTNITNVQQM